MILNTVVYGEPQTYIPITTASELTTALQTSNALPLKIMNDISVDNSFLSYYANTIDLGGHTISGDSTRIFLTVGNNMTISNGTLSHFTTCLSVSRHVSLTLNDVVISDCANTGSGGAISLSNDFSTLTMNGGAISNCSATSYGGAIYSTYGTVTMTDVVITECTSGLGGNALYLTGSEATLNNCTVKNCSAISGIRPTILVASSSTLNIIDGVITGNAVGNGSSMCAVYIASDCNLGLGGSAVIYGNIMGNYLQFDVGFAQFSSSSITLLSNYTGQVCVFGSNPSVGSQFGTVSSGVTSGANRIVYGPAISLIGSISGNNLVWASKS